MGWRWILLAGAVAALGLVAAPAAEAGDGPVYRYKLVDRFGERGTGPGEFPGTTAGPVGIAVDLRCGDVYVSDSSKQRVQRFDQRGRFLNYVGAPDGAEPLAEGELHDPTGLDVYVAAGPNNFYGPPGPCSPVTTLITYVWVADLTGNRVAIFEPGGQWVGSWCNHDLGIEGCDVVDGAGIDYYPHDVDATDSRVYVAGISTDTVREYDRSGTFLREGDATVDGAVSTTAFGGQLWLAESYESQVGLYSLDPGNATINRYHELGSEFSTAPGSFTYVQAVATAPNGTLYVLDPERVLVFSPSGRYLTEFDLPQGTDGEDIAVRFDETVYIADDNSVNPGVLAYAPGPLVSLKLRQSGSRTIRMSGKVRKPAHAGRRLKLQRLAANGWRTAKKARLDRRSRYKVKWKAPRAGNSYVVRAFFRDPHRYHADRTSQIRQIKLG